jgi:hypothetical protein
MRYVSNTTFAAIAIVSALALFGVVAVTVVSINVEQAQAAGCQNGFPSSFRAGNASQGRCIR